MGVRKHPHLNSPKIPERLAQVSVAEWEFRNFRAWLFPKDSKEVFYCRKIGGLFLALGTGEVEQNIFRAVENAATQAGLFIFTLVLEGFSKRKSRIRRKWLFCSIFSY